MSALLDTSAARPGILPPVAPSPVVTSLDDLLSPKARDALRIGRERHAVAMNRARIAVNLARDCNGRDDCPATHHLACCLRPTAKRERGNR